MNEISQALNLDITRRSNIQVIHLVQNDVASRKLVVKLTKDGVVQTITGTNLSAIINITRPDAQHASFPVTFADSTITAVIPTWAQEVAGQGLANFSILEGTTQKLSCENLVLDIQRSNNSSGDISQDDDTDILLELIAETHEALALAQEFVDTTSANALVSEGHAKGTQDGVPVGSSSPYYHNNSKYWAKQAAESKRIALAAFPTDKIENAPIASFPDGADNVPMKSATFAITPVQDLHGYDSPWPAGGGVNKFNESVFSNYGGALQISGVWHFDTLVNILNKVLWTAPESIGQLTVTMWRKQSVSGSQGLRLVINYTDGTSVKVGNQNATGGTDVYSVTTDASKTVRDITGDYGANQYSTDVNVVVSIGSTAPSAYSPYSNICPITGFTGAEITAKGANIWDEETESGYIDPVTGAAVVDNTRIRMKNYMPVQPNTTYYKKSTNAMWNVYFDKDKNYISYGNSAQNTTFTTPSNCYFIRNGFETTYGTTYKHDTSFNYPSTGTAYHASVGTTHEIAWQDEAGTVYGGTLQYLGGDAWRLTKTMESVDMGTLNWTSQESIQIGRFDAPSGQIGKAKGETNMLCDKYPTVTASVLPSLTVGIRGSAGGSGIVLVNTAFANYTPAQVKTAVTGTQLVYELATPVVYDLTGEELVSVLGMNNVFANCGDVTELVYRADTALFVEKKLGA